MNNIPILAKVFGANYKTMLTGIGSTLSSVLVFISLIPYTLPTELSTIMSPALKPNVLLIAVVAKLVLGFWNSVVQKDKDVHGGTIIQDAKGEAVATTTQTPKI